jgi:superfamily I DNA and RNA helicase
MSDENWPEYKASDLAESIKTSIDKAKKSIGLNSQFILKPVVAKPIEGLRGTGRTTKMLAVAKNLVAENPNRRIVVVMGNSAEANKARILLPEKIKVIHEQNSEWCWKERRIRGFDRETVYLIDHYAIEKMLKREFGVLIDLLHEHDPETMFFKYQR